MYLDCFLNIDNPYFEQMVGLIYPIDLQLNKANSCDTEAHFYTWTCPKQMKRFHLQYRINEMFYYFGIVDPPPPPFPD